MSLPGTSKAHLDWIQKRRDKIIIWKESLIDYGFGYAVQDNEDWTDHIRLVAKYLFRGRINKTQLERGGGGMTEGYLGAMLSSALQPPAGHEDVCIRAWVLQSNYDPSRPASGQAMQRISERPGFDTETQAALDCLRAGRETRAGTFLNPDGSLLDEGDRQSTMRQVENDVKNILGNALKGDSFFRVSLLRASFPSFWLFQAARGISFPLRIR